MPDKSGVSLNEAAIARVTLEAPADPDTPSLIATNSLLQRLSGPAGFARLEYVTVLEDTQVASLQASDCIFVGPFDEPGCVDARSCVRYSRLPASLDPEACAFARARSNVTLTRRVATRANPSDAPHPRKKKIAASRILPDA